MFGKKQIVSLLAAGGLSVGLPMAGATDRTFDNVSGNNWSTGANWTGGLAPSFSDKAIIPSGETCYVDISNAECDHLEIASTGVLSINAGSSGGGNDRKLTLDHDGDANSTINGTINLLGQYSSLVFITTDPTLSGSGKIVGSHNDATIDFGGRILASGVVIEGNLHITADNSDDRFVNNNTVNANHDGVLLIDHCSLHDDSEGGAIWKTSALTTSGTPILRLNHDVPGNPQYAQLFGEFQINAGLLEIQTSIQGWGKLKQYGGKVTTDSNSIATFSYDENDSNDDCVE
jgi:hypothetical protein